MKKEIRDELRIIATENRRKTEKKKNNMKKKKKNGKNEKKRRKIKSVGKSISQEKEKIRKKMKT